MFLPDPKPDVPPALLDITLEEVAATMQEMVEIGERVTIPVTTMCRALEREQQAGQQRILRPYGNEYVHLPDNVPERVWRLHTDYLGRVGEDGDAYAHAVRLLAFQMFHDPEPRSDTEIPKLDMTDWPFNHIDWHAAAAEYDEWGSFETDVFVVDGYAFRRAWTWTEINANEEDLFR